MFFAASTLMVAFYRSLTYIRWKLCAFVYCYWFERPGFHYLLRYHIFFLLTLSVTWKLISFLGLLIFWFSILFLLSIMVVINKRKTKLILKILLRRFNDTKAQFILSSADSSTTTLLRLRFNRHDRVQVYRWYSTYEQPYFFFYGDQRFYPTPVHLARPFIRDGRYYTTRSHVHLPW